MKNKGRKKKRLKNQKNSSGSTISSKALIQKSNEDQSCLCMEKLFAMGFDPYVSVKHYPSQIRHQTEPVYDAKRTVLWTEKENNHMQWTVPADDLQKSVLSMAVFDDEFGIDPQIGTCMIKVDEHFFGGFGDVYEFEASIKRKTIFTGLLHLELKIIELPATDQVDIHLYIKKAEHLKKERDSEFGTEPTTMFWVISAFMAYLAILAACFVWVENPDNQDIAVDDPYTDDYNEYAADLVVRVQNWGDGFWFAFITATTVGYGDKRPETKMGRYINSFVMCADVLVIGFALSLIVEFIAASAQKANSRMKKKEISEDKRVNTFYSQRTGLDLIEDIQELLEESEEELSEISEEEFLRRTIVNNEKEFRNVLIVHVVLVAVLIVVGSIIFWQEEDWTYAQSLHFAFVTMSTVGYGDISPSKTGTKIFCMFYIIFGVGLLVRLGTMVCEKITEQQQRKIQQKRADEAMMHWEQIAEYDDTGDGELDLYEFSRAILKATGKASSYDLDQIEARFLEINQDGDEYITGDDFALLLKKKKEEQEALKKGGTAQSENESIKLKGCGFCF